MVPPVALLSPSPDDQFEIVGDKLAVVAYRAHAGWTVTRMTDGTGDYRILLTPVGSTPRKERRVMVMLPAGWRGVEVVEKDSYGWATRLMSRRIR